MNKYAKRKAIGNVVRRGDDKYLLLFNFGYCRDLIIELENGGEEISARICADQDLSINRSYIEIVENIPENFVKTAMALAILRDIGRTDFSEEEEQIKSLVKRINALPFAKIVRDVLSRG